VRSSSHRGLGGKDLKQIREKNIKLSSKYKCKSLNLFANLPFWASRIAAKTAMSIFF
jgi:hypothetical protein